jgi:hypothetical protein
MCGGQLTYEPLFPNRHPANRNICTVQYFTTSLIDRTLLCMPPPPQYLKFYSTSLDGWGGGGVAGLWPNFVKLWRDVNTLRAELLLCISG